MVKHPTNINKRTISSHFNSLSTIQITSYDIVSSCSGLGQAHICGGIRPAYGIWTILTWYFNLHGQYVYSRTSMARTRRDCPNVFDLNIRYKVCTYSLPIETLEQIYSYFKDLVILVYLQVLTWTLNCENK